MGHCNALSVPRIGMLLVVVLGMAANWMLAEALSTYLLQRLQSITYLQAP